MIYTIIKYSDTESLKITISTRKAWTVKDEQKFWGNHAELITNKADKVTKFVNEHFKEKLYTFGQYNNDIYIFLKEDKTLDQLIKKL